MVKSKKIEQRREFIRNTISRLGCLSVVALGMGGCEYLIYSNSTASSDEKREFTDSFSMIDGSVFIEKTDRTEDVGINGDKIMIGSRLDLTISTPGDYTVKGYWTHRFKPGGRKEFQQFSHTYEVHDTPFDCSIPLEGLMDRLEITKSNIGKESEKDSMSLNYRARHGHWGKYNKY